MTAPAQQPDHVVPGLSFDDDEIERRRSTLGASDIPAVAGLNPYKTALDVYLEKRGLVAPFAGNASTEWGLRLEDAIAQKYAEVARVPHMIKAEQWVHAQEAWMTCTPDRLVVDCGIQHGLEIKRFGEYRADDFGSSGTNEVAIDVAAQCHWSMMITGLSRWDVAVLLGQADFRVFRLDRDEEIAKDLYEIGRTFWFDHVLAGVQPALDGSPSAHRFLQQKYRAHSGILLEPTPAMVEMARDLARIKGDRKALESQEAILQNQICNAIGDAQGIRGVATWKLDRTGRPTWKAIAEEAGATPDMIQRHTNPPTRRFRLLVEED